MAKFKVKRKEEIVAEPEPQKKQEIPRWRYKKQNELDPVAVNLKAIESYPVGECVDPNIPGPIIKLSERKYITEEKRLRDPVIAHGEDGKRVFAFHAVSGKPICYCRDKWNPNKRCQDSMTFHNGRCKRHGGRARSGALHHAATQLRDSSAVPQYLRADFERAKQDPDLLRLDFEAQKIDAKIKQYEIESEYGLDVNAMKRFDLLMLSLEGVVEGTSREEVDLEELCQTLTGVWNTYKSRKETDKEVERLQEHRRKMTETMHRIEKDRHGMLRLEQAMALAINLNASVNSAKSKFINDVEEEYLLISKSELKENIEPSIRQIANGAVKSGISSLLVQKFGTNIAQSFKTVMSNTGVPTPMPQSYKANSTDVIEGDFKVSKER